MAKYTLKHPIFALENVTAGYDGKVILKDLNLIEHDLSIEGGVIGQTICFIGRSGRGKSTLFKLIAGLMKPIEGKVLINNEHSDDPNSAKEVQEGDVSMVDQKYTLFRHKTVKETFMFALRKSGLSKEEKEAKVDELLIYWGLHNQRDQYPHQLSGGQKQRTAIVAKSLTGKTFMILDEPISGLDPISVDNVKDNMQRFKFENDLNTIIFATHDLNFAVEMADVIYILGHKNPEDTFSTIVDKIDLREMDLYQKKFGEAHNKVVEEIKIKLRNS